MSTIKNPILYNGYPLNYLGGVFCLPETEAAPSGGSTLLNGLVAYWNFDDASTGIALDSLGLHDGSIVGSGVTQVYTPGKLGKCVYFNNAGWIYGSNSLYADNSTLGFTGPFSISFWVKTEEQFSEIMGYSSGISYWGWGFWCNNWRGRFYILTNGPDMNVDGATVISTTGLFHHIVGTYDGAIGRLYVDGVHDASLSLTSARTYSDDTYLFMGNTFTGFIDEIGAWNKCLTPIEVSTLYNEGDGLTYPFA